MWRATFGVAQCFVCLAATESGASGAGSGKRHEPAPESPASSASSLLHFPLLLRSGVVAAAASPSLSGSPRSPCWPLGSLALPGVAVSQLRRLAGPARSRGSLPPGAPRPPRLALLLAPLRPSLPAPHRNPRATQQDGGQIDGSRCPWRKPARQDCETDSTFAPTKSQSKLFPGSFETVSPAARTDSTIFRQATKSPRLSRAGFQNWKPTLSGRNPSKTGQPVSGLAPKGKVSLPLPDARGCPPSLISPPHPRGPPQQPQASARGREITTSGSRHAPATP